MRISSTNLNRGLGIFASKGLVEIPTWRAAKAKFQLKSFLLAEAYIRDENIDQNVDMGENLEYFDQSVEADAYGREIGARLRVLHPRKTVSQLFLSINSIKDAYCKHIINVYRDPRISEKANHAFFRALYDYLEGNGIV